MQKHWYIVYTRPKCEKKVAASLTKKKIDNFCPLRNIKSLRRKKIHHEPLFDSYVFAYTYENAVDQLKIDGVVSVVYWKGHPAIITEDEINLIKKFTATHQEIKLIRSQVNPQAIAGFVNGPSYSIDGKVLAVKNKSVKVNLPSLGFIMVAEMETDTVIGREVSFGNKELLFQ